MSKINNLINMSFEKPPSQPKSQIREYSEEVLALMYPKDEEGRTFIDAVKTLAARKGIPYSKVGVLMSKIGKYIKNNADLKRWENQAVEVPIGKHLEPVKKSKEPYEDPFVRAERIRQENIRKINPMFPEIEEERLNKQAQDEFYKGVKKPKVRRKK